MLYTAIETSDIMYNLIPKDFFDRLWRINAHLLRAKFGRWKNQRCYFVAADDSFIWKVLEEHIKNPDDLPKDYIIVNAIFTGQIWRKPKGWGTPHRFTIMEFRGINYEWINRKGNRVTSTTAQIFGHSISTNRKREWGFTVEEVLSGGLTLKQITAGFASEGRSSAGESKLLDTVITKVKPK